MEISENILDYEQAYAELEKIVSELENNQKTLEESLKLFERGQVLAQYCTSLLDKAELRVRQLSQQDIETDLPDSL